jgi:hypothetical protein
MSPARRPSAPRRSSAANRTSGVSRTSGVNRRGERAPEPLQMGGLLLIWGAALAASALGVLVVHEQFRAADLQIETTRLQRASSVLRDEAARLDARLGEMRGGPRLRERATAELGMVEPASWSVERLEVDPFRVEDYRAAERRALEERARALADSQERGATRSANEPAGPS